MSRKTSTAALDSLRQSFLPTQRRFPRHPAGIPNRPIQVSVQKEKAGTREIQQARIAIHTEDAMRGTPQILDRKKASIILPVILRITLSLVLWALGVASMNLTPAQTREHRVVQKYAVDRAKIEALQRWVNAGHDTWCRHPQSVAAAALQQISPELSGGEFERTSAPIEEQPNLDRVAVYTFHSFDGLTSIHITLRRYSWLLKTAGTYPDMVWVPVQSETITRESLD